MAVLSAVINDLADFESTLQRGLRLHQHQVTWGDDAAMLSMSYPVTQIDWDASRRLIVAHFNEVLIGQAAASMQVEVPTVLQAAFDLLWLTYIAPTAGEL